MAQIRVLIVEDCPPILEGLKTVLAREADITVVGEALSGQEALRLLTISPATISYEGDS